MSEIPEAAIEQLAVTLYNALAEAVYPAIREQVLADATARIEALKLDTGGFVADLRGTHNAAIDQALAALNQPQTEKEA